MKKVMLFFIGLLVCEMCHAHALPEQMLRIKSVDMDSVGAVSAYLPHLLEIENLTSFEMDYASWTFDVMLKNGGLRKISEQSGADAFEIPSLAVSSDYWIEDGYMSGTVTFSCRMNGENAVATCGLLFDLRPRIVSVDVRMNIPEEICRYRVDYAVRYYGNNYFRTAFEEEYSSKVVWEFIHQPFYAELTSKLLNPYYYSWIDILVENNYGRDTYTITIPPLTGSGDAGNTALDVDLDYTHIQVFGLNGVLLRTLQSGTELQYLPSGFYVVRYMDQGTLIRQCKYVRN